MRVSRTTTRSVCAAVRTLASGGLRGRPHHAEHASVGEVGIQTHHTMLTPTMSGSYQLDGSRLLAVASHCGANSQGRPHLHRAQKAGADGTGTHTCAAHRQQELTVQHASAVVAACCHHCQCPCLS